MNAIQLYEIIEQDLGDYMPPKPIVYSTIDKYAKQLARRYDFPRYETVINANECCEFDFNLHKVLNARPAKDCICNCYEPYQIVGISRMNQIYPQWAYECHCPCQVKNIVVFDPAHSENKVWAVNSCCSKIVLEVVTKMETIKKDDDLVWSYESDDGTSNTFFDELAVELIAPLAIRELARKAAFKNPEFTSQLLSIGNYAMQGHRATLDELQSRTNIAIPRRKVFKHAIDNRRKGDSIYRQEQNYRD